MEISLSPRGVSPVTHTQTKNVLNRLAKIKGHIEGIREMVEADRSCTDVVTQVVAVRASLNKVAQLIMLDHMEHCLVEAAHSDDAEGELESFRAALCILL